MASSENSQSVDWDLDEGSGFVIIHGRGIHLNTRGPLRSRSQLVIICEADHEDKSYIWTAVRSQTGEFVRTFTYDRAGMGQSQPGPNPRTAAAAAKDLSDVLVAADIAGPYILVCHSYGGFVAREFLHIRSDNIAGIIFVDTITERYSSEDPLPMPEFGAVFGNLDFWEVSGMTKRARLSHEEWKMVRKQWPNDEMTSAAEAQALADSERELADKNQFNRQAMGDRPVVVIKGNATQDFKRVLVTGEAAGNGTESQRAVLREYIQRSEATRKRHQREQLKLSSSNRFVVAQHGFHSVHLSEPELIVTEIKLLLKNLSRGEL